jgi:hypothetical protein
MDPIGPNSNRDGDGVASTEVNCFVVRETVDRSGLDLTTELLKKSLVPLFYWTGTLISNSCVAP